MDMPAGSPPSWDGARSVWEARDGMDLWSVVRLVRATSFSAACALLAAAGHVFGGGRVDGPALLLGLAVVFVPALALTGRERTMSTILPAVAAAQVLLHTLLPDGSGQPDAAAAAEHAQHATSPGLGMLLMHVVAVLVTAWWLECGEAKLCALVRRLAGWVLRPLRLERPAPAGEFGVSLPVSRERHGLRLAAMRHVVEGRGPPIWPAAIG
ncbi:hypothetical protein GCM10010191_20100 [Actinomadura vinacea]|uniref:MFS transporter n=1 Tax=Actinomadura vinacea TaxID=115336 RepID=A0ABN3IQL0_9ACTN